MPPHRHAHGACSPNDPEAQARIAAFAQGLQRSGLDRRPQRAIDIRWARTMPHAIRKYAAELVALAPDVISASGTATVARCCRRPARCRSCSRSSPIRSAPASSRAWRGRAATSPASRIFEYSLSGKWLELLKEIAPRMTRAAVLRDPTIDVRDWPVRRIQSVAPSLGMDVSPVNVRDAGEIERAIADFRARSQWRPDRDRRARWRQSHRDLIITLAARHKLPAIYHQRFFVAAGGLISYGPDLIDQFRRAAGYVDRILKGEKPADLPVQAPTKYELVINLKTAKALGLDVPPSLLARADEVIE